MTAKPKNDLDRQMILQDAVTVIGWYLKAGHSVSHVTTVMEEHVDDGLKAVALDGKVSGGDHTSTTESIAIRHTSKADRLKAADNAHDDLHRFRLDIAALGPMVDRLRSVQNTYTPSAYDASRLRPGIDPCPPGWCIDHWTAGHRCKAAKKRDTEHCRKCSDHRQLTGWSMPTPVIEAAEATRALSADGRADWHHWTVERAWRQCGGRPLAKSYVRDMADATPA